MALAGAVAPDGVAGAVAVAVHGAGVLVDGDAVVAGLVVVAHHARIPGACAPTHTSLLNEGNDTCQGACSIMLQT